MSRLTDRERAVWDKRNSGLTFNQIAEELGLCPATVSFAYRKAYRKIEYENAMKISKLTEYENLGSVEDFKQLSHELEVYKRALKNEIPSNYYELEKVENEEQYINLRLDKARKEFDSEVKYNN